MIAELLRREVVNPLIVWIVPGAIAVSPSLVGLLNAHPHLLDGINDHLIVGAVALFAVTLVAGVFAENFGSRIESIIDRRLDKDDATSNTSPTHLQIWDRYLTLAFETPPTGQGYLHSILLRLKFELGMVAAMPFSMAGMLWLGFADVASWSCVWILWAIGITLMIWLLNEAKSSCRILGKTRRLLVDAYWKPPTT